MHWLHDTYPGLVARHEEMYARSPYGPKEERNALSKTVSKLIASAGGVRPRAHIAARFARARAKESKHPEPKQLKLI